MPAVGINLPDVHRQRADAIAAELRRRYHLPVSRSAAIQHAIDHFFMVVCPNVNTNDQTLVQNESELISTAN